MSVDGRSRTWTCIIYPDSAPDDYINIIRSWHIEAVLSPLHDADKNGDESEKKPHWHLVLIFLSKKSFDQVWDLVSVLNGVRPQAISNLGGMIRYLVHIDNPEKAQYSKDDIVTFCGYDVSQYFKPSKGDAAAIMNEMKMFIIDNDISEFEDLQIYALQYPDTWGYVLNMYNCLSIYKLLDSRRNARRSKRIAEVYANAKKLQNQDS